LKYPPSWSPVQKPDIVFVRKADSGIIQRRAIVGVPSLLVEIISPASVRRDRYEKRDLYARFGVVEYWLGDPANRALEILTLRNHRYELHGCAEEKGVLSSPLLAGLQFDLGEL
jgi:Uma2 family endonuclease